MLTPSEVSDRALLLSPEAPYPLTSGGAMRSSSMLQFLARSHSVHLVTFRESGTPNPVSSLPIGLANPVTVIDLPYHRREFWARSCRNTVRLLRGVLPLTDRFGHKTIRHKVLDALDGQYYNLAMVEHFWCAPYLPILRRCAARVILNLHNIESILHERCAETESWPQNIAHQQFSVLARKMEHQWISKFDLVLVASETDRRKLLDRIPGVPVAVYPNSIPLREQPSVEEENIIAFSGNWAYRPNLMAVKFFKSIIWPRLRHENPGLRWRLIGKNEKVIQDVAADDTSIELTGTVQDPITELAKARLVVVPLLSGSGTRIKILEAWAAGRAVVSTIIGAEGLSVIDGGNIRLADGHLPFAKAVSELLQDRTQRQRLGSEGRRTYEKEGTWSAAWQSTASWLRESTVRQGVSREGSCQTVSVAH